jgi:hypothetical protein
MALTAAATALKNPTPTIPEHAQLEDKLGKYCGLVLYMKEMDEERYQKLCAVSWSLSKAFFDFLLSPSAISELLQFGSRFAQQRGQRLSHCVD